MARQKPRKPFPTRNDRENVDTNRGYISNERNGIFGFLSDRGVRETIESVVVAIILALLFRTFEAEAFVIPTGSMAPALQGQHRDINCDQCGYLYQTGASEESSTASQPGQITHTFCPICRFKTVMSAKNADHTSNNGDRILVNKFVYDFSEPERFDVIVFKNPNNGKQNYIKRLIGLPGEVLIIENGDIFKLVDNGNGVLEREIIRKPSIKLRAMLQLVDDTHFIPQEMHDAGWPLRWQQWDQAEGVAGWGATISESKPTFAVEANGQTNWLGYRHLVPINRPEYSKGDERSVPEFNEWEYISIGEVPKRMQSESPVGSLITDYYCYNDRTINFPGRNSNTARQPSSAMHWVGDLGLEFWLDVKSDSGKLKLRLVEGGAKFICTIDVASGEASLKCDYDTVAFESETGEKIAAPKGQTGLKGSGKYRVVFANVDDQIRLSINNKFVDFDAPYFQRTDKTTPRFFPKDPTNRGDAEPAAIGAENLSVEISRLKILRDVYYSSPLNLNRSFIDNETTIGKYSFRGQDGKTYFDTNSVAREKVWQWIEDPNKWESAAAKKYFGDRFRLEPSRYQLGKDQFLPMGDNSPSSLDGRVWDGPKHVDRDMLIGRALFIYWPHALNSPVPFFPNFQKMKFIR